MKKLFLLALTLTGLLTTTFSQSVVTCESYNSSTGQPSGIYSLWNIKSGGGYINILYSQGRNLSSGEWYLYIDRLKTKGEYTPYETISLSEDTYKNWLVYQYTFKESGKFKIDIMKDAVSQATCYVEIQFTDGTDNSSSSTTSTYYDDDPYADSKLEFCESVSSDGVPDGVSSTFKADRTGAREVTIFVDNDGTAFKTTKFYVDIYDKNTNEKIDSYSIDDIDEDWTWVKFKRTFTKPGEYSVEIYNEDDDWINTASLTITR